MAHSAGESRETSIGITFDRRLIVSEAKGKAIREIPV